MTEQRDDTLGEAITEAQRTAREEQRWTSHNDRHDLAAQLRGEAVERRWADHLSVHKTLEESLNKALDAVAREADSHAIAHRAAHDAHEREHMLSRTAHDKEHSAQSEAVSKVESTTEKRFEGVNEFREQLREQAGQFARSERVDQMQKDMDRRFEEQRLAITNLEKGDVKGEGRALGQGATVALIVGAVSFVGAILGIVIVVSNFVSAT